MAEDFNKQIFRGLTLDNIFLKSSTPKDFDDMARFGVNLVRTGLDLQSCTSCNKYTIPQDWLLAVDKTTKLAGERNIRVILTLAPEKPEGARYWKDSELQESIIDVWVKLAEHYRGNPGMGGFDLINEPAAPGDWKEASHRYTNLASRIIVAVRKVDPERMIVFEPAPRGNIYYGFKPLDKPLPFSNVLYSPHFYQPIDVTLPITGGVSSGLSYPSARWDKKKLSDEYFEYARNFSHKYKLPLYIGEFSCIRTAPNGSAYNWEKDAIELFEAEGWSWTYHSFRGWPGFDPEIPSEIKNPNSIFAAAVMRRLDTPSMSLLRKYFNKNISQKP